MPSGPHILLVALKHGYQTRSFAANAKALGVEATLATDRCAHMDDPWADNAVSIKFQDPIGAVERLLEAHRERGLFTAVAALGDRATFVTSLFAEQAAIPFHPPHAVEAAGSKFLAKERFRAAGLRLPHYQLAREIPTEVEFPCVLKPLHLSGSRGVIRANNPSEFASAFQRIQRLLRDPDIVRMRHDASIQIESYIPGDELAIEGIVTHGKLRVLAIFDKPDPLTGPYFEETIYVSPSRHSAAAQQEIVATVERGIAALGLNHGPIHAEVRYNEEGAWLLEIAARPIGGYCSRALRFTPACDLEGLILRHALGESVDAYQPLSRATGVMMIPIPRAGWYRGVQGLDAARAVPGIDEVLISAAPGQQMQIFPEASSYIGFLFSSGDTPQAVEEALRQAHRCLHFDIAHQLA